MNVVGIAIVIAVISIGIYCFSGDPSSEKVTSSSLFFGVLLVLAVFFGIKTFL